MSADTKHLVTDQEAQEERGYWYWSPPFWMPKHLERNAGNVVMDLLDTREALIRALTTVLDAHPDNRAYAKANARAFLNTLRGES